MDIYTAMDAYEQASAWGDPDTVLFWLAAIAAPLMLFVFWRYGDR